MRVSRSISHRAQYTALVDILFATIGVFVIVFALQDLDPPQVLQPAPYDHLIVCDADGGLTHAAAATRGANDAPPITRTVAPDDLAKALASGGRVLIALDAACMADTGGKSMAARLREVEEDLSDRVATATSPLILFEFAPLGAGEVRAEALRARFLSGERP